MDDQYEYWKDKIECIIYNTITHNLTIQFTRPSIPDVTYKYISIYDMLLIRTILYNKSKDIVYDAHDFSECYYGISPSDYNYILNRYLKGDKDGKEKEK